MIISNKRMKTNYVGNNRQKYIYIYIYSYTLFFETPVEIFQYFIVPCRLNLLPPGQNLRNLKRRVSSTKRLELPRCWWASLSRPKLQAYYIGHSRPTGRDAWNFQTYRESDASNWQRHTVALRILCQCSMHAELISLFRSSYMRVCLWLTKWGTSCRACLNNVFGNAATPQP